MKRNYILITIATALFGLVSSCKEYLNVQPEDKVIETQLFSSRTGVESALNGLYINLAKANLYGDNLTLSTIDILAQRYNIPSTHNLYKIATYAYSDAPTSTRLEGIWSSAYTNILSTNAFLENLEKYKGVVDEKTEAVYKGEAIAMRAFIHLDLLRIFGPRYSTADSTKQSIPYYDVTKSSINPLLPANDYIVKVINDLNKAADLLKDDPIVTVGVGTAAAGATINFFTDNRNYRLNYYAVKALLARAYLYRGDKVSALKAAKEVISVSSKFPWTTSANALSEKQNPDRVYTTEMIFGIINTQLYSKYTSLFDPSVTDANILAPLPARLNTVFENNENDYRFNSNWQIPSTGIKAYKTFYKYADIVDKDKIFRLTIPLIRISEVYYIAAESEPINADGVSWLNTVRQNRGLLPLAATININTELQKEYQKEFFGEGQLFYYYKRRNVTSIGNGSSTSNITISYNIPLPLSESQYR